MFIALAILLGLFLLGVILTMCARRIRQRRMVKSKPLDDDAPESADPWTESARRLQPYPRQPKPPEA